MIIDATGGEVVRKGAAAARAAVDFTRQGTDGIPIPAGTMVGTGTRATDSAT